MPFLLNLSLHYTAVPSLIWQTERGGAKYEADVNRLQWPPQTGAAVLGPCVRRWGEVRWGEEGRWGCAGGGAEWGSSLWRWSRKGMVVRQHSGLSAPCIQTTSERRPAPSRSCPTRGHGEVRLAKPITLWVSAQSTGRPVVQSMVSVQDHFVISATTRQDASCQYPPPPSHLHPGCPPYPTVSVPNRGVYTHDKRSFWGERR